ncbi:MAG: transcriptional regulator NrdR [Planctomycetes bacterium GWA2_50_13]|nr:MAG: transcriptional regulator NrdR [Planctomycetes bacterium GWA2_50_13]OHB91546.1 MAG: transcriptional regulator NrdR [Planctomycetes bacterium RIFCSPHIGHO2_12_FULL_51_37]OHB95999.1 MAG: transcriptional regulator NrdR [Planctomycetes bacterium RIFCSPLOWO2_02_FULL_50_16]OHC02697.1 MAG: transcriptional regulator NrdR [Planctomycetes bacterium RIFCSPLOWO2_12_FULL_50_35]HCN19495.1 transcriptional regulator NrdR [Planctomycetia bacterium]
MQCPYCKQDNDRVINSRPSADGLNIKRRRECLNCKRRYTTYERMEETPLKVIKKDGRRVAFDRNKIRVGLEKACEKRPVSADTIELTVSEIERDMYNRFDREVPSKYIGEQIMQRLKTLDKIAYVRFASVYREFKDITEFMEEVKPLIKGEGKKK